jgi:hypothetical protein
MPMVQVSIARQQNIAQITGTAGDDPGGAAAEPPNPEAQ